jgi:hypothetical protein
METIKGSLRSPLASPLAAYVTQLAETPFLGLRPLITLIIQ